MDAAAPRLLIADDHTLFRRSLKALLEASGYEIVGETSRGLEAVELAGRLEPDAILMDLRMPDLDGLEATRRILERRPEARVIVLTGSEGPEDLADAVRAGARGFLPKTLEPARFLELLARGVAGEPAVPPELASQLYDVLAETGRRGAPVSGDPMVPTERELEVLEALVAAITSTRDLAAHLGVSESTVKYHVKNLLEKLQADNRAQLVSLAVSQGWVEPPQLRRRGERS